MTAESYARALAWVLDRITSDDITASELQATEDGIQLALQGLQCDAVIHAPNKWSPSFLPLQSALIKAEWQTITFEEYCGRVAAELAIQSDLPPDECVEYSKSFRNYYDDGDFSPKGAVAEDMSYWEPDGE